jgi:SAM-dependent methyltransferase
MALTRLHGGLPSAATARARCESGVHGQIGADLSQWEWPEAEFDVVAAIFIQFASPPLRKEIFNGIKRTLKPGGLLLLEGYRPEQLKYGTGGPSASENLYTEVLLREAFSDFELLDLRSHDSAINEGVGHSGMSALIDLVARKPA